MIVYDIFALVPLSCAAYQDAKRRIIPNWTAVLVALCALLKHAAGSISWIKMLGSGIAIGVLLLAFSLATNGAGGGDIKLCAALGVLLGFQETLSLIILALTLLILCGKLQRQRTLPFAPFLWIAFTVMKAIQILY